MNSCIVGIDVGGTSAKAAALGNDGNTGPIESVPTGADRQPEELLDQLAWLARKVSAGREITAVGLGSPGLLDLERGVCVFSGNLNWREVAVGPGLSRRLQAPVYIDNDVNVAALGEYSRGQAKGCRDFIYITVGTGIGAGIFCAGRLLRGPRWVAGEVGHMVLSPDGPECTCGSRGCLEALASASAIAREGRAAAQAHPDSKLAGREIDAALVARLAREGDPSAANVWQGAMAWLGIGVANLVNIFNPQLVVIGGGVSLAGEQMLQPVQKKVTQLAMPVQRETVRLALSALGDKAGVWGALELAREQGGC